jgi:hypothetical protein
MIRLGILTVALAAAAPAFTASGTRRPHPISCRLLSDEQRKCAFGSCGVQVLERLRRECVRDSGLS